MISHHSPRTGTRKLFGLAALIPALLISGLAAPRVFAQESPPEIEQIDSDGDGQPEITVIPAAFHTASDAIWVYDGADNMEWGNDWHAVTDFEDDTWLFDVGDNGDVQLIIAFSRMDQTWEARLYDDQDGDGQVAFSDEDGKAIISGAALPLLTVRSEGGWRLPNGRLNWNVRFSSDGPKVQHIHTYNLTKPWQEFMYLDGQPDAEVEFHDRNLDGISEYGLYRLLASTPEDRGGGIGRTWIWSNEGRVLPADLNDYVFWPYLSSGSVSSSESAEKTNPVSASRYFDSSPGIVMNWEAANISHLSFPGYPIEKGFHVNTLPVFEKGAENYANFENFQAYYDLAADQDGSPELHVRHGYFGSNDRFGYDLPTPVNSIRWSWNQMNEPGLSWDYKLDLAGRYPMTIPVNFTDFSYLSVPYQEIPTWIQERTWDIAAFVAREDINYTSSEGIYTWNALGVAAEEDSSAGSRYLAGQLDMDVERAFTTIEAGWRGEIAPHIGDKAQLYVSPVDRRLHLKRATRGIADLDGLNRVVSRDLNRDGYLDQWTVVQRISSHFDREDLLDPLAAETSEVSEQLALVADYLIYSGQGAVRVKRIENGLPAIRDLEPPANHVEWLRLGAELERFGQAPALDQLGAMLDQFEGPVAVIQGAEAHGVRPEGERGFRFILELQPSFKASGAPWLDLSVLPPGEYLVQNQGQNSIIMPLIPAQLSLEVRRPAGESSASAWISLRNSGLADATGLSLVSEVVDHLGEAIEVDRQPVEVLAGQATQELVFIPPSLVEGMTLRARLEDSEGRTLAETTLPEARNSNDPDLARRILGLSTSEGYRPGWLVGLALIATVPLVVLRQYRIAVSRRLASEANSH